MSYQLPQSTRDADTVRRFDPTLVAAVTVAMQAERKPFVGVAINSHYFLFGSPAMWAVTRRSRGLPYILLSQKAQNNGSAFDIALSIALAE